MIMIILTLGVLSLVCCVTHPSQHQHSTAGAGTTQRSARPNTYRQFYSYTLYRYPISAL